MLVVAGDVAEAGMKPDRIVLTAHPVERVLQEGGMVEHRGGSHRSGQDRQLFDGPVARGEPVPSVDAEDVAEDGPYVGKIGG